MIADKLEKLEQAIRAGSWKPDESTRLWAGANVVVTSQRTKTLTEWQADRHLVFDGSGVMANRNVVVVSKHAAAISNLFYELKQILRPLIDYNSKYIIYGRLGMRAATYVHEHDDIGVLLEIIDEAKRMAREAAEVIS